jgi:hypothetical protein
VVTEEISIKKQWIGAPHIGDPPTLGALLSYFSLFYLNKLSQFTLKTQVKYFM